MSALRIDILNFMGKLIRLAREASERLLIQTLWDAHPGSFYHSAAQEIKAIVEYAVARALSIPRDQVQEVCVRKVEWVEQKGGSRKKLLGVEWEGGSPSLEFRIETIPDWQIDMQVAIPAGMRLEESLRNAINHVLEYLFLDLHKKVSGKLKEYERTSFFGKSLSEVIQRATTLAKEAYSMQVETKGKLNVQIMLYHPGEWDDSGQFGFLFYPTYVYDDNEFEIPQRKAVLKLYDASLFKLISGWEQEDNEINLFGSDATDRAGIILSRTWFWHDVGKENWNEMEEWQRLYKTICPNTVRSRLSCVLKDITEKSFKEKKYFAEICKKILTHPNNFLERDLLLKHRRNYESGEGQCSCKPVCLQPKGSGVAGKVAETYITELIPEIGAEGRIDYSKRKECQPYLIMGMFEKPFGLRPNHSGIATPLFGKGQLLGVLIAFKEKNDGIGFTQHDVEIFESIASKVGKMLQEAKDYMFFTELINEWFNTSAPDGTKYQQFVIAFSKRLPFIMNALTTEVFESVYPGLPSAGELSWDGKKVHPSDGSEVSLKVTISRSDIGKLHFLKWSQILQILNFCVGAEGSPKDVLLYIPAIQTASTYHYMIKITLEEPESIFLAHKDELEVFFNYCFAITGAVRQVGELEGVVQRTELTGRSR